MWFSFGLITFLVGFTLQVIARSQSRWRGETRASATGSFDYQEVRHKGRLIRVRVGVPAPNGLEFRARKERPYDVFFKRIGVCAEMQMHDPKFDDAVFLESDLEALGTLLTGHAELRSAILSIFAHANASTFAFVVIRCSHGRLWVEYRPDKDYSPSQADAIGVYLHQLSQGLTQSRAAVEQQKDPFVTRAIVLLSASTATIILGVYGLIRAGIGRTDILEPWHLLIACIPFGLLGVAVYIALTIAFLGRSSRTHLVLVDGILVGGIGFILSAYALAREFDMEFDQSEPTVHELRDFHTEDVLSGRRRNKHRYYLLADDWREPNTMSPLRIEISAETYRALAPNRHPIVSTKAGRLGYEWIESIDAVRDSGD